MRKGAFLCLLSVIVMILLVGCNATRGAGKDLENAGKGVQKIVDHND